MHPTLKICQMSTRGTLTRKGCIFGLRRTFGNRSSTNTPPWTPFASHARTSVTLRSWSWHSSRLLLLTVTRKTGLQTYSDELSFSADSFALLPFIRPQRVFQIRQWLPVLPGTYILKINYFRAMHLVTTGQQTNRNVSDSRFLREVMVTHSCTGHSDWQ